MTSAENGIDYEDLVIVDGDDPCTWLDFLDDYEIDDEEAEDIERVLLAKGRVTIDTYFGACVVELAKSEASR